MIVCKIIEGLGSTESLLGHYEDIRQSLVSFRLYAWVQSGCIASKQSPAVC
jgi:hypothetical protein